MLFARHPPLCFAQYHLERMVRSRASGEDFIPSKSSIVTRVLRDACGGNSRTAVLVFLSPRLEGRRVTMHSLQFAASARNIRNRNTTNAIRDDEPSIRTEFGGHTLLPPTDDVAEWAESDGALLSPQLRRWLTMKP
jgi:hypothetical protein